MIPVLEYMKRVIVANGRFRAISTISTEIQAAVQDLK
jgi:hypothetical protein